MSQDLLENVLIVSDSLSMRQSIYTTTISVSVSGSQASLTIASSPAIIGSKIRLYNQADLEVAYTAAEVISNNGSTVVIQFPFSVVGRITATTSVMYVNNFADTGYIGFARGLLNKEGRFTNITNFANGGATTDDIIESLSYIGNIQDYDCVVELSGINDLTNTDDPLGIIANKNIIYNYFLDRGIKVIAGTIWPVSSGDARDTTAKKAAIITINDWIRARCASNPNMICWDGYAAIKDPATDYALAGMLETSGVHPLVKGALTLGQSFYEDAGEFFPKNGLLPNEDDINYFYNYPDAVSGNLLTNPEFTGTGGGKSGSTWSGNMPDNWNGVQTGGTTTLSTTDTDDGLGKVLRVSKSATGSNTVTVSQDITSVMSVGRSYRAGFEYETNSANTGHYIRMYIQLTVGGVSQSIRAIGNTFSYANGGRLPDAGTKYKFETDIFKIPSGTTAVSFFFAMDNGASGSFAVDLSRPFIHEV